MAKLVTINGTLRAFAAELADEGVKEPLASRLTLAAVWADLARIAGEAIPSDVLALIDPDPDPPPGVWGHIRRWSFPRA